MTAYKGYHIDHEPLRALHHAQGQLIHSHKDMLLFFGLDVLEHLTVTGPLAAEISQAFPAAGKLLQEHADLIDTPKERGALFSWTADGVMTQATKALAAIAEYSREKQEGKSGGGAWDRAAALSTSTAAYLEMATAIRNPDTAGKLQQASKINPYVSARFFAAYLPLVAESMKQCAEESEALYHRFAEQLRQSGSRIGAHIPETIEPVYLLGAQKISGLFNVMNYLSAAAELAKTIKTAARNLGESDPRLLQQLDFIFSTTAVYDWQQFRQEPANNSIAPPNNLLKLKIR